MVILGVWLAPEISAKKFPQRWVGNTRMLSHTEYVPFPDPESI